MMDSIDAIEPLGFGDPLSDPSDAKVDIVFVHGLNGHRIKTWISPSTGEIPSTFWPKDLLPKACKTARILSFGYNSKFVDFFPFYGVKHVGEATTIDDYSSELQQDLAGLRDSTGTPEGRPIIFVAHSLGGLVVANALSRPHGPEESTKNLTDNTVGVIFMGTPFEGSEKAPWASAGLRFLDWIGNTKPDDIQDLEQRSAKLISINDAFIKFLRRRDDGSDGNSKGRVQIACYFEQHPTFVAGKNIGLIVGKASASIQGFQSFPVAANHSAMCKFEGDYVNGYRRVSKQLGEWISALDKRTGKKDGIERASIIMGDTNYGTVSGNSGVITGNVYSAKENGISIIGSKISYGHSRSLREESDDELE